MNKNTEMEKAWMSLMLEKINTVDEMLNIMTDDLSQKYNNQSL